MTGDKPLISVIVPIYKVEKYMDKCIDSIVRQTYKNLEILLIDDGSPDGCPRICDEWEKKDSRIIVIHKENGGLSSARNIGLDHCHGQYVSFVDSDDWIDERFIEVLYEGIIDNEVDISVVGVWRVYPDKKISPTENMATRIFSKEETVYSYLYFKNNLVGGVADKLFRTELFNDIRFPMGITSEDRYAWALICNKIRKLYFNPEPLYYYVCREGSITNSKLNKNTFDVIKITEMVCDYLMSTGFQDMAAIDFFRMKAYLDTLYKMLTINAPNNLIEEYKKKTRSFFGKVMQNKRVSLHFKIKYFCYCFFPKKYEYLKNRVKR